MPAPWLGPPVCSVDGQDPQGTTPTLRVEATCRRWSMEVHVQVCMEDGVCVGVNVVKRIKCWWCVAKAHDTTNTCSHCITPSTPVPGQLLASHTP